jgi:uncharacterized alkaline shock family protein YloU
LEHHVQERAIELDKRPGRIEVAPAALASAAVRVVLGCSGVVGMASPKLKHGKAAILDDKHINRGVSVSIHGESVVIEIFVVVEYGVRISAVANTIVHTVRDTLGGMLGAAPIRVTVHVQGLQITS